MVFRIKNISIIIFLSLSVIWEGCSPKESHVKFKVYNLGTSNIFVQYFELQTTDTINVQIAPNEIIVVWDALHVGGSKDYTNWYYDYEIQINYITNALGDSTIINPNIANYWAIANNEETEYRLYIWDTSF